jgi:hypothetical protein
MDNTTFVRITSSFTTEIEMSGIMSATWERTYKDMLSSLISCLSGRQVRALNGNATPELLPWLPCIASSCAAFDAYI